MIIVSYKSSKETKSKQSKIEASSVIVASLFQSNIDIRL